MKESNDFEEILSTFNAADVAFMKSVLDGEGIEYFFKNERFTLMEPVQPTTLLVRTDQAERVRELLKDFDMQYLGASFQEDDENDE
ncbi:putative signal transducing protein [candidate division KSB1 bacterium]